MLLLVAASISNCGGCPDIGWNPEEPDAEQAEVSLQEAQPLKGDTTCLPGAADCNVCAPNVQAQFEATRWHGNIGGWSFDPVPALAVSPRRAYRAGLHGHVQGFVRLNTSDEAYAMVHSRADSKGFASLSFIGIASSRRQLLSLFPLPAPEGHTTGAFVLGDQVGVLVEPRVIAFVDVASSFAGTPAIRRVELSGPKDAPFMVSPQAHGLTDWSGGIAMAKRDVGDYVLLANEGGSDASSGRSHIFYLPSVRSLPDRSQVLAQEVGKAAYPVRSPQCAEHHHSENVSLVTECGTGDLYAVHVGSNDRDRHPKLETGTFHTFWRLSRLIVQDQQVTLEPRGVYLRMASFDHCHGRSGGSAFVDPVTRRMHLLCHEREKIDPSRGRWHFWSQVGEDEL
jgi:hypothetical protein